jgi:ferredoxin
VHKPKGVVFGPTIVYDAERCIVCTRCVRFCEEVAKDPVLDMRERGNLNEITVSPGRELDHDYTLMTEHVCPVGALTAIDFRFKARVWFLRSARRCARAARRGATRSSTSIRATTRVPPPPARERADQQVLDVRRGHALVQAPSAWPWCCRRRPRTKTTSPS